MRPPRAKGDAADPWVRISGELTGLTAVTSELTAEALAALALLELELELARRGLDRDGRPIAAHLIEERIEKIALDIEALGEQVGVLTGLGDGDPS